MLFQKKSSIIPFLTIFLKFFQPNPGFPKVDQVPLLGVISSKVATEWTLNRVATRSEKSGKIKKNRKSQVKMGVFKKKIKSSNLNKFLKMSDFVCLNLQNFLFSKAFKW